MKDKLNKAVNEKQKKIVFEALPTNAEELKALPFADLRDPYAVAAMTVAALCVFPKDREACYEMMNYLKGPRPLSQVDMSFIRDRFMDGVDYVPRSYFVGTSPDNDYSPSLPYTVNVLELAHSRDQIGEGYLRLFIRSSGADSERFVVLRHKPSTDQWFVWQFEGLLSGIRQPKSKDEWA
ncbi:MAG: hypothetical protein K6G56_02360 [Clostridiales bacterium]|nr:hypothetical protein [Clostridiales bacterium]